MTKNVYTSTTFIVPSELRTNKLENSNFVDTFPKEFLGTRNYFKIFIFLIFWGIRHNEY